MNKIEEIIVNNLDIIYFNKRRIRLKCHTKMKTNLDGLDLKLDIEDISLIINKKDEFLGNEIGGFICYDIDDQTYLLSIDNILEMNFNKKQFKKLQKLVEIDNEIKLILFSNNADKLSNEHIDDFNNLINKKRKIIEYFKGEGLVGND